MKIEIIYLSADSKNLIYYKVIYIYRHSITKYYFKIRFNGILRIRQNNITKTAELSISRNLYTYKI